MRYLIWKYVLSLYELYFYIIDNSFEAQIFFLIW